MERQINFITAGVIGLVFLSAWGIFLERDSSSGILGRTVTNAPTHTVAQSELTDECGPQENVQLVATTSKRSYLYVGKADGDGIIVSLGADNDNLAVVNEGAQVGSTTPYEFSADKGNLYVGGVRCTASASTTVSVVQYAD